MMLWQQILLTLFVAACTLGFLGGLAWLVSWLNKDTPGHESLFTLLRQAEVKCPYCGRYPTSAERNNQYPTRIALSCDLMHYWRVNDEDYLLQKTEVVDS